VALVLGEVCVCLCLGGEVDLFWNGSMANMVIN